MGGCLRLGVILHWRLHAPHELARQSTGASCISLHALSVHLVLAGPTQPPCAMRAPAPCMGGVAAPWKAGLSPLWEGTHLWRASAASIDRADFPRGGTQPPRPADCSSGALDGPPSHLPELAGATPDASGHRGRVPAAAIEIGALRTHWLGASASTMGRGCVLVGGGGAARPPLVRHLGVPPLGATDQGLPAIGASPLGCIDQGLMAISAFCG